MKKITKILMLLLAVVAVVSCQKDQETMVELEFDTPKTMVVTPKEGGSFKYKLLTKFNYSYQHPSSQDSYATAYWNISGVSYDYKERVDAQADINWSNLTFEQMQNLKPLGYFSPNVIGEYGGVIYFDKAIDTPVLTANQIYHTETPDGSEYIEITIKPNILEKDIYLNIYVGGGFYHHTFSFTQKGK